MENKQKNGTISPETADDMVEHTVDSRGWCDFYEQRLEKFEKASDSIESALSQLSGVWPSLKNLYESECSTLSAFKEALDLVIMLRATILKDAAREQKELEEYREDYEIKKDQFVKLLTKGETNG